MPTRRSKTVCLQGDAGGGKSKMATTAPQQPVHFADIDRKILSAGWAQPLLDSGQVTVWELEEPVDKANFNARVASLTKNSKPLVPPQGWTLFGEYFNAHNDPNWVKAGTVVIDSATVLNEHLKTHIQFLAGIGKFEWDHWNALKKSWMDTLSALRDLHRAHGKDLILTVHERDKSEPGDKVTGVKTEATFKPSTGTTYTEVYQGTKDYKVWASIDGAFGNLIGVQMDEYYHLYVDTSDRENPIWRCRVKPDGMRNLRTSFNVDKAVYEPDFKAIWK